MEELINAFNVQCTTKSTHITYPPLYFDYENRVHTTSYIYENTVLGEIKGVVKNIYEVPHADYMVLYEENVIDLSEQLIHQGCRDIITYIAEDNDSWSPVNCRLLCNEEGRFYLKTMVPIYPHQELVYRYEEIEDY